MLTDRVETVPLSAQSGAKNLAQGASPGLRDENDIALKGRKNGCDTDPFHRFTVGRGVAHNQTVFRMILASPGAALAIL